MTFFVGFGDPDFYLDFGLACFLFFITALYPAVLGRFWL